jgi:hypothetical protein
VFLLLLPSCAESRTNKLNRVVVLLVRKKKEKPATIKSNKMNPLIWHKVAGISGKSIPFNYTNVFFFFFFFFFILSINNSMINSMKQV